MGGQINRYSSRVTQPPSQSASQSMLYGIGLTPDDMGKAQIGIVSMGYEGNTCNMHLNDLARIVKAGVSGDRMVGLIFNTIGVSDGISMGTEGMKFSLQSRDLIADSIETVVSAQWYDGIIGIPGCDKNMPGSIIAMGRLNRPALMIYGGTISPGRHRNQDIDIVTSFQAYGEFMAQTIDRAELTEICQKACPGQGACGGMYTANTMASAIEALGMSLPSSSSSPATSKQKTIECEEAGKTMLYLLEHDIKPRDIMTRDAFENAIATVMALGGSTNAVLHLIAMAKTVGVPLRLEDFQRISDRTPYIGDLKPSGKYVMEDLHKVGGVPALLKTLLKEGLLHGSCLTVTGRTLEENLEDVSGFNEGQKVIYPISSPIKPSGHIQILYGNLAQEGAVAKITGKEGERFKGPARIYDSEELALKGLEDKEIKKGDVVVIRYEGPRGGPGMREMLTVTSAINGAGLGNDLALITDGRFSGGTHGFVVGHITPEAQNGGLIALVENGDQIEIDAVNHTINLHVDDYVLAARRSSWQAPPLKATSGTLWKYAKLVSSASEGCVTDGI
ncbi:dihydroxy-acid dehydratase [Candidatus Woesearchaeota archaeon]|nr:dihydroxy-acid dehydratase [Candidatus Woesearchaeota archaeon]